VVSITTGEAHMSSATARAERPLPGRAEAARHRHAPTLDDDLQGEDAASADEGLEALAAEDPGDDDAWLDAADAAAPNAADAGPADAPRQRISSSTDVAAMADDAALCACIERIARQDERALEMLYDHTASRVYGVVLRITQRAPLAEEVLEDTFWQVWRQAPRFDLARGRPITWLLAMARPPPIDALRREQRFVHDDLPEDDSAGAAEAAHGQAALPAQDLLEATREHAHVHAALASLEPRSRQLVALAFFRGLTHEEIAEQQGMPLGTVKSLIRRALQQLKRVMEAEHA
jgi:RNA polymerase sigma-70 factor (ECF subfamily)